MKKVDALTKSIEIESKKVKREAAAREKEATMVKLDETRRIRSTSTSRRLVKICIKFSSFFCSLLVNFH